MLVTVWRMRFPEDRKFEVGSSLIYSSCGSRSEMVDQPNAPRPGPVLAL